MVSLHQEWGQEAEATREGEPGDSMHRSNRSNGRAGAWVEGCGLPVKPLQAAWGQWGLLVGQSWGKGMAKGNQ